ncbi:MAG: TIGR01777 family oxidoreductase [Verrucomicrobiota bacterium]|nr:TIGR01777 family oxidoreductase [Verrucomicrobiota bacterium]
MKVAITGATGFLGHHLVGYLAGVGHECIALSRDPRRAAKAGFPAAVSVRPAGDLPPVDAVIHLAGESIVGWWTPWKRRRIFASRIDGTRRLVEAMRAMPVPPRVLLGASAVGYYGHRPGETLDETAAPDSRGRFRSKVCVAWERAALEAETLGVRVVLLRLGNIIALDGGFLGRLLPLYRAGPFIVGQPEAKLSWISREDAVRLIAFALEKEEVRGPLNVVAPHAVTQHALATTLAERLGRRVIGSIPSRLVRAVLGEFADAVLDEQEVVPAKALAAGFQFRHPAWRNCLDALFNSARCHSRGGA